MTTQSAASAPSVKADGYPRVGGHAGIAVPILTLAKDSSFIGADFAKLGVTPGITVHLDENWSIDFEFIAMNNFKGSNQVTTFIVDPGVLRKFGPVTAGLRIATEVGAPANLGLVPILVVPVAKVGEKLTYFVEADLPLFVRDVNGSAQPSASLLLQTGFGF